MDSTFAHEFFHMPCAQWVGDIPADARQNNILWKMGPLKAHGHRLSPSLFTPRHRGRSYLKWPQMKIATEPAKRPRAGVVIFPEQDGATGQRLARPSGLAKGCFSHATGPA